MTVTSLHRMTREGLDQLCEQLHNDGYQLIGPKRQDEAIIYDEISGTADLPAGWTDVQAPGSYKLTQREDDAYFAHRPGPHSWKKFLFPAREKMASLRAENGSLQAKPEIPEARPMAFIGLRPCDLAAVNILDRVFGATPFVEPRYRQRRNHTLIIAVNCLEAGELCFCDSMGTGPRAEKGFDLCLSELGDGFLVEAGSPQGEHLLARLPAQPASEEDRNMLEESIAACRQQMGRKLEREGLPATLFGNLDHPRWEEVGRRCLSCGNCTQVCPTCFCFSIDDLSTLTEPESRRERYWDSCFTWEHSTIHGSTFRPHTEDRYRQWLTHKLGSWESQFGSSGCVGCGRCIAWCPVGIDLTEEVAAIRENDSGQRAVLPSPKTYLQQEGNVLLTNPAHVIDSVQETPEVVTLYVQPSGPFRYAHGQFNMLAIPGIGDIPISIAGSEDGALLHTVRGVGAASKAVAELRPGQALGLRGPFGNNWPLQSVKGLPVVVIAGGIGLAPLRGALKEMISSPQYYPDVQLLYGTRKPADILYLDEIRQWEREHPHFTAQITVDYASPEWKGRVGVVTRLLKSARLSRDAFFFICGPEIMMRFTIRELLQAAIPAKQLYVSMERSMKCAAGYCGRCQYGPYFVCKDGPIFSYDQIDFIFGKTGF